MEGPVNTQEAAPTGRPFSWALLGLWIGGLAALAALAAYAYARIESGGLLDVYHIRIDPFGAASTMAPVVIVAISLWTIRRSTGVRASLTLCLVQWVLYMVAGLLMIGASFLYFDRLSPLRQSQLDISPETLSHVATLGVIAALLSLALIPLMVIQARKAARGNPTP